MDLKGQHHILENCDCIWLYLSRNKMIWIPEMGRQCYGLIDAMFIETMWRLLVERMHELTWSHRHTRARGRHPISMRGKWRLTCIFDFFNMKTLLKFILVQKLISSKYVVFQNNLLPKWYCPFNEKVSLCTKSCWN